MRKIRRKTKKKTKIDKKKKKRLRLSRWKGILEQLIIFA